MTHPSTGQAVRCCNACINDFRKSTSQIDHEESQLSREVQAKNQETFLRRELEEKLKQTEDNSRNALDFANRELAALRVQLSDAANERRVMEGDYKQQVTDLTTEVYWNKQKVAEVTDENRKLRGEKEALIDTCRQLQTEHTSALNSYEQGLARRNSIGASGSTLKPIETQSALPSQRSSSELEANAAIAKSELLQCKSRLSELLQTLRSKDDQIEALQIDLQTKSRSVFELTTSLSSLKSSGNEQSEDLSLTIEGLSRDLQAKEASLVACRDEVERLKLALAEAGHAGEGSSEQLIIQKELNDELFEDLRLIKQFLKLVTEGEAETDPEMNPRGRSNAQILNYAESNRSARSLLERIADALDGQMYRLKDQLEEKIAALAQAQSELSIALGAKQKHSDMMLSLQTEFKALQDASSVDKRAAARKHEELRQALAAKTVLCDNLTFMNKQAEEKLHKHQSNKDEELRDLAHKLSKSKKSKRKDDSVYDALEYKRLEAQGVEERNALQSEVARLTIQARDLEVKLVDQSERRRRLEEAYEDIKGYAPEYIKDIISQATKYDHKYSSIESLITQIEDLKDQLRLAKHPTNTPLGITTGALTVDDNETKRRSMASQDTELQDWDKGGEEKHERDRCACRLF
jgi:chromosome segregation ATPase